MYEKVVRLLVADHSIMNLSGCRAYTPESIERALEKTAEKSAEKICIGEFGMGRTTNINLHNITHVISDLQFIGGELTGKITMLETVAGKHAQELINVDTKVSFAMRATVNGSMETFIDEFGGHHGIHMIDTLDIIAFDLILGDGTIENDLTKPHGLRSMSSLTKLDSDINLQSEQ